MTCFRSVAAATVAATLVLGACGGDGADDVAAVVEDSSISGNAFANDADMAFAQNMIPHHSQAVDMAILAEGRTENPEILDLAERIRAAQDPEIQQMRAWQAEWGGEDMPDEMEGMDHGQSGMMDDEEMAALMDANGGDFDRLFAEMMIRHHEGAIAMAQAVIDEGADPDVRALAEAIISAQTAEIEEMRDMNAGP